jgi:hypothetical protein
MCFWAENGEKNISNGNGSVASRAGLCPALPPTGKETLVGDPFFGKAVAASWLALMVD